MKKRFDIIQMGFSRQERLLQEVCKILDKEKIILQEFKAIGMEPISKQNKVETSSDEFKVCPPQFIYREIEAMKLQAKLDDLEMRRHKFELKIARISRMIYVDEKKNGVER